MSQSELTKNRSLLVIDDHEAIHRDFKKILCASAPALIDELESELLGDSHTPPVAHTSFEIDSALQGEEGYKKVLAARDAGRRYAVAFVDMRMPPGWDGVQTIVKLWEVDPYLEVVICTAHSDYSWREIIEHLGETDRLLILKKPFDEIEVRQLALAPRGHAGPSENGRPGADRLRTHRGSPERSH
jgi:CheY-like chemotaxis protein